MLTPRKTLIYLDLVLLIMTAAWILFGISKGIDSLELMYNYVYVIIAMITMVLNIKVIRDQ